MYIHTHTYIHTYIHTYLHTHTYIRYIYKYPQEPVNKQEENENTIAVIESALNKQQVSQKSLDRTEEEVIKLAARAQQKEKLARDKAQEKAVIMQLEDAINKLKTCIDDHRAVVMSDLPVGAILEIKHEKLKEAGVSICISAHELYYRTLFHCTYLYMYVYKHKSCDPIYERLPKCMY